MSRLPSRRITDRHGRLLYEAPLPKARSSQVMDPKIAFLMTKAMQNVLSHGTGFRSAELATSMAGKTGTANNATDNWFCGYSKDLVTIAWVGTDEHVGMNGKVGGGRIALPLFDTFMSAALRDQTKKKDPSITRESIDHPGATEPFPKPPGVLAARIDPRFGHSSDRGLTMYFLEDNGPGELNEALEALSTLQKEQTYRAIFTH